MFSAAPALAQGDAAQAEPVRDTILVTATKREVSLDRSSGSISAITGEQLAESGIFNTDEAFSSIANVQFEVGSLQSPEINIRGVTNNGNGVFEPGVPVFIDEVYLARPVSFTGILSDVERIEVLRGPQGTLFGKNTVGGLLHVITKKPTDEFETNVDFTYGSFDLFQARGTVNIPLVEGVSAIRITAAHQEQDGWIKNLAPGAQALYGRQFTGVRGQFSWSPAETFSLLVAGDYSELEGTGDQHSDIDGDPFDRTTLVGDAGGFEREDYGVSARAALELDNYSIVSLTSYRDSDALSLFDQDFSVAEGVLTAFPEETDVLTQELRISSNFDGPFNFIAGLYYLDQSTDNTIEARFGDDDGDPSGVVDTAIETSSLGLFASLDYQITDKLSIAGGARYTDESKDYDFLVNLLGAPLPPGSVGDEVSVDDSGISGDISLNYQVNDALFTYVKFARGFKAGGFDNVSAFQSGGITTIATSGFIPFDINQFVFEAETINNYEAGFKWVSEEGRYRLYGSGFFQDYTDRQEQITREAILGGIPVDLVTTANAGEVEIWGAEFEGQAVLSDWFTLAATLGHLNAEYKSFIDPAGGTDLTGNELQRTPRWNGSVSGNVILPITDGLDLTGNADLNFKTRNFLNEENTTRQDAHSILNLRVGVEASDGRVGAYIFGKNITDTDVFLREANPGTGILIQPATWGFELRASL